VRWSAHFAGATELDAAGFGAGAALARPRADELALELGKAAEHGQHLKEIGRQKWPSATEAQQFERAFTDPANAELAATPRRWSVSWRWCGVILRGDRT
jgi:hypothetical protein